MLHEFTKGMPGQTLPDALVAVERPSAGTWCWLITGAAIAASAGHAASGAVVPSPEMIGTASASGSAVLAALGAYLFLRRLRRTNRLVDVLVTVGLTLIALIQCVTALLPTVVPVSSGIAVYVLISSIGTLVTASCLAAAAFAPDRTLPHAGRSGDFLLSGSIVAALALVPGIILVQSLVGTSQPGSAPIVISGLLTGAVAAVGASGFLRRGGKDKTAAMPWLGLCMALLAVAALDDALFSWAPVHHVSAGDLVQVGALLAVVIGGLRDLVGHSEGLAQVAVQHERARLARELHDGLAQELAYITSESRRLAAGGADSLVVAAERALEESRAAISGLTRPADQPLEVALSEAAYSLGYRTGLEVIVVAEPGVDADPDVRHALLRIMREAVINAGRHGQAKRVRVSLKGPGPIVMTVADDGRGIDPNGVRRPDSLGLRSMLERAENLGGRLTVDSRAGEGTTVVVVLP